MSKKEKLLADAQKLIQKGQTDKAIACFQETIALDPGDLRVRQRLAELFAKLRRLDEARKEFEVIGKSLTSNGFYMKAIAIYKQIEKLFPEDINIALILASLHEKHGLGAAALVEYKRVFDHYEKLNNASEALKALDAMQRVDARNPNIKLKYAEVLFQNERLDEALVAFETLGHLLVERRDDAALVRLSGRLEKLFPQKSGFVFTILEQEVHGGGAENAASVLQSLIRQNQQNFPAWRLLITAYQELGNLERLEKICQYCSSLFPSEPIPRELLIRCLLDKEESAAALTLLDESEQLFISAGLAGVLKELYFRLNDSSPLNVRILKGCVRACEAAGDKDGAATFSAKIGSLAGLGGQSEVLVSIPENSPFDGLLPDAEESAWPELEQNNVEVEPDAGPRELDISDFLERDHDEKSDDLCYEIEVELDEDEAAFNQEPSETWFDTVHDIFGSIRRESGKVRFGDGVDTADAQSQYDLGMAFWEMGLYDEAIHAFWLATGVPELRISCMVMQGACLREKGELKLSESVLAALQSSPDLTEEETCALKYELGLTLKALGKQEQSKACFDEVKRLNPSYRDLDHHLSDGSGASDGGFDFDEDDLLDFDLK